MIELRPSAAVLASTAGGQERDAIAHLAEQSRESAVEFITEPSAILFDYLLDEAIQVEDDGSREGDIQILKRHRLEMRSMNASQRFKSARDGASVSDAAKIYGHLHALLLRIPGRGQKHQLFTHPRI